MATKTAQNDPELMDREPSLPAILSDFRKAADDPQMEPLKAIYALLQTGPLTRNTKQVHSAGDEAEKKKKEEDKQLFRMLLLDSLNFGGFNIDFGTAMENLATMSGAYTLQIQQNMQSLVVHPNQIARYQDGTQIMTAEALKTYEDGLTYCPAYDLKSADQVTLVNGVPMDAENYAQVAERNMELAAERQRIDQYSAQLKSGDMTWDNVPDDIKVGIVKVEQEKTTGPAPEPTVLDMLNTMNLDELKAPIAPKTAGLAGPLTP